MSFDVQEVLPDAPAALPVPDAADLGRPDLLIRSMAISQMLGVVCDAGVPDALAPFESRAATAIAAELGLNEQVCLRVLRALSTFQYFRVDAEGNVRHNERSLLLRSDRVPSYASAARFWASAGVWQAWGQLRHALRTGSESFRRAHEMQFFDYMATHPAESDIYNSYMACGYPGRHQALASIMNCPDDGLVIDVGGGTGSLMKAVLERHLSVRAIVLDTEATATQGAAQLDADLADRLFRLGAGKRRRLRAVMDSSRLAGCAGAAHPRIVSGGDAPQCQARDRGTPDRRQPRTLRPVRPDSRHQHARPTRRARAATAGFRPPAGERGFCAAEDPQAAGDVLGARDPSRLNCRGGRHRWSSALGALSGPGVRSPRRAEVRIAIAPVVRIFGAEPT
jgi:hypothetical protein